MREILFRGKRIVNGDWTSGGFHSRFDRAFIIGCSKSLVIDGVEVLPETVGQYTGLTDKNGKRIFEGDVVQVWWNGNTDKHDEEPEKYKAVVEFGNPNCEFDWGYQLKMIDYIPFNKSILLWVDMEESGAYCEVIGNIHDHPELIAEV